MYSLIPLIATAVTFLCVGIVVSSVIAVAALAHNQQYMHRQMQGKLRRLHAERELREEEYRSRGSH